MSMRQNRKDGQDYLTNKILELARAVNIQIDDMSWSEPPSQDVSILTLTIHGKKKPLPAIKNSDLEAVQGRNYLDQIADQIVKGLA